MDKVDGRFVAQYLRQCPGASDDEIIQQYNEPKQDGSYNKGIAKLLVKILQSWPEPCTFASGDVPEEYIAIAISSGLTQEVILSPEMAANEHLEDEDVEKIVDEDKGDYGAYFQNFISMMLFLWTSKHMI
ncbi:1860_t:CDS:2, partial [Paraglomus brasilianum]